jgi:hypothetical protein
MPSKAKHNCLAIDHELLAPVPQRGLGDLGETSGPVIAAAGDQPHAVTIAFNAEPVTIIFDLVEPLGPRRARSCRW